MSTITMPTTLPAPIATFPHDVDELPVRVRKITAEYLSLRSRLEVVAAQVANLTAPATIAEAQATDLATQASAVRRGDTAVSAGSSATEALGAAADDALAEQAALIVAVNTAADEMRAEFAAEWDDDGGHAAALKAGRAYKAAVANVTKARNAAIEAIRLPQFVLRVAHHSEPTPNAPIPWGGQVHQNMPPMHRHLDPHGPIPLGAFEELLSADADLIIDRVNNPYQ